MLNEKSSVNRYQTVQSPKTRKKSVKRKNKAYLPYIMIVKYCPGWELARAQRVSLLPANYLALLQANVTPRHHWQPGGDKNQSNMQQDK